MIMNGLDGVNKVYNKATRRSLSGVHSQGEKGNIARLPRLAPSFNGSVNCRPLEKAFTSP